MCAEKRLETDSISRHEIEFKNNLGFTNTLKKLIELSEY